MPLFTAITNSFLSDPEGTVTYFFEPTSIIPPTKALDEDSSRIHLLINAPQPGLNQIMTVYVGGPPGIGIPIVMNDTPLHPQIIFLNKFSDVDAPSICKGEIWISSGFASAVAVRVIATNCSCGQITRNLFPMRW